MAWWVQRRRGRSVAGAEAKREGKRSDKRELGTKLGEKSEKSALLSLKYRVDYLRSREQRENLEAKGVEDREKRTRVTRDT